MAFFAVTKDYINVWKLFNVLFFTDGEDGKEF